MLPAAALVERHHQNGIKVPKAKVAKAKVAGIVGVHSALEYLNIDQLRRSAINDIADPWMRRSLCLLFFAWKWTLGNTNNGIITPRGRLKYVSRAQRLTGNKTSTPLAEDTSTYTNPIQIERQGSVETYRITYRRPSSQATSKPLFTRSLLLPLSSWMINYRCQWLD